MIMKIMSMIKIAILSVLFTLTACSTIKVSTDFNVEYDFNNLTTYAWMEPKQAIPKNPLVDNDLMNERVRRSVAKQLTSQGFAKAEGDNSADFLITYHISTETKISIKRFHNLYGYYPYCWNHCFLYNRFYGYDYFHGYRYGHYGPDDDISVVQYQQSTFMLDIIEPATNKLIWRGVAKRQLPSGNAQQRDIYIDEIVTAILAQFPPPVKLAD